MDRVNEGPWSARVRAAAPWALAVAIVIVYAPTLGAGFLDYDDGWLVRDNPFLRSPTIDGLIAIWTDLARGTRLALGAEYLPVRDTTEWIAARTLGIDPLAHRAIDLAIYVAACLLLRSWLVALMPRERAIAETTALLFALHPVHAESVAWIAGRKDVLALLFVASALLAYGSSDPRIRRALVPLLVALACFSKASAVVLPLLLGVHDVIARRRPDPIALAGAALVAAIAVGVHVHVGAIVQMIAAFPGGSRAAALATMGPVTIRYLMIALGAPGSLEHDVPERTFADPMAIAAWLALATLVALAAWRARRGDPWPAIAVALFAIPLLPVSQVLAPLQNRMADRYLLLSVLGPSLLVARAAWALPRRELARGAAIAAVLTMGGLGAMRAMTFADPIALWVEASDQAPESPLGPYQLAMAVRATDSIAAEGAFAEAIRRDGMRTESGRRSANNLAILQASQGRLPAAIALLEQAVAAYPDDARVRHNLAQLYEGVGDVERAAALRAEIVRRFPTWRPNDDLSEPH